MTSTRFLLCVALLLAFPACKTPDKHREIADAAAYKVIAEKTPAVPGMYDEFTIEPDVVEDPLADLPVKEEADDALGAEASIEVGAHVINLEGALGLAFSRNRTYQNQKEALYLEALALTLDRHQYTPIFRGGGSVDLVSSTSQVTVPSDFAEVLSNARDIASAFEAVTGTPADLLRASADLVEQAGVVAGTDRTQVNVVRDEEISGSTNLGVDLLLKGGGRIALALSSNFFRFLSGDSQSATSSLLTAAFTQPLMRGAGREVALERLTQAERDMLYRIRDFTRFRQEFAVDVCSSYYGVLQARDIVENTWRSYQNFQRNVELERAFAAEGRRTLSDLGRLEQAQLTQENQWINAVRRYKELLDQFKITLGLSTDAHIVLDSSELVLLREEGLMHPDINVDDAVQVAMVSRLDVYNSLGRTEDTSRQVVVAANQLKMDLGLAATARVASTGRDRFQSLDFDRVEWGGGLDVGLPLERTAERHAYRAALISHERSLRDYTLNQDNVKLSVRAAWRNLDQALRNYQNALQSLDLSQRRVEQEELLAELGRSTAINLIDAQNALTAAQNDLTNALVNHTLARLQFWRDMGILYIKRDGQWEEVGDDFVVPTETETMEMMPAETGDDLESAVEPEADSADDSFEPVIEVLEAEEPADVPSGPRAEAQRTGRFRR